MPSCVPIKERIVDCPTCLSTIFVRNSTTPSSRPSLGHLLRLPVLVGALHQRRVHKVEAPENGLPAAAGHNIQDYLAMQDWGIFVPVIMRGRKLLDSHVN
jgi:hypothetical protein